MTPAGRVRVRFALSFGALLLIGAAATAYLLVMQRAPVPFGDVYAVKAEFAAANGLVSGIGQPVNVAGVKVGQVTGIELDDGRAVVTFELKRDQVPVVRRNATATLAPITPLKDLQINLDPGAAPAPPLYRDVLPLARTKAPVELADALSSLDVDTRAFVTSLLAALESGTAGRAADLRRALLTLGPTTEQINAIVRSLHGRRRDMRRLVHNIGTISRAATRDGRLAAVVRSGNSALGAIAEQDAPLREAIARIPRTLAATRGALDTLGPFASQLDTTLEALEPSVKRLPRSFTALKDFAGPARKDLREQVRPFLRAAAPLARDLGPAIATLASTTPSLARSANVLRYFVNELAYNPPGDDEGNLFWLSWFGHNINSTGSLADAHGGMLRATVLLSCRADLGLGKGVSEAEKTLASVLRGLGACPE